MFQRILVRKVIDSRASRMAQLSFPSTAAGRRYLVNRGSATRPLATNRGEVRQLPRHHKASETQQIRRKRPRRLASRDWFNPSIAHQVFMQVRAYFLIKISAACTQYAQQVRTPGYTLHQAEPRGGKQRFAPDAIDDGSDPSAASFDPESAALGLSRCLGRTGPAASRARRAAHHPAGSFSTRLLPADPSVT